jgi:hypothetical protein
MSNKTIADLNAKIPAITDLIPVADPVTGEAGKATAYDVALGNESTSAITFSPTPDSRSLFYGISSTYCHNGVNKSPLRSLDSLIGGAKKIDAYPANYLIINGNATNDAESNIQSVTINSKYLSLDTQFQANAISQLNITSFSAPNLISGNIIFSSLPLMNSCSLPNLETGQITFSQSDSLFSFAGTLELPKFKHGLFALQNTTSPLTTVSLPEMTHGSLTLNIGSGGPVSYRSALTTLNVPKLKYLDRINMANALGLTNLSFPELEIVNWANQNNLTWSVIQTISFPKLKYIFRLIDQAAPSLTSIYAPMLIATRGAAFSSISSNSLTTIDLPELVWNGVVSKGGSSTTAGSIIFYWAQQDISSITSATSLTTINMPKVKFWTGGGANSVNITGAPNLQTFTVNQTPMYYALNFICTGAALNQASVDGILVALAYQDGVANAPYPAWSNKTVNLSGGTSATPSATGLAAKATLVARGCTVTHN